MQDHFPREVILLFYLLSLCKISFIDSFTRLFDILLGPCFKTGQFHCIPISSFGKQRIIVLHYLFSSLLLLKENKNKTQYTLTLSFALWIKDWKNLFSLTSQKITKKKKNTEYLSFPSDYFPFHSKKRYDIEFL